MDNGGGGMSSDGGSSGEPLGADTRFPGSSKTGVSDAIKNAVEKDNRTYGAALVVESIEVSVSNPHVSEYKVVLKPKP